MSEPYSTKHHKPEFAHFDSILVEDRLRREAVNAEELAESIRDNGLFHPPVVQTWRSLDNDKIKYRLLAGGRRFAAMTLLRDNKVECVPGSFDLIPVTVFDNLSPDQQIVIELEENIQRESMTWQETLDGIVKYHKAKRRMALVQGDNWTQTMTGKLLNMSQAKISVAIKVWECLQANDEKVKGAANLNDAIKVILDAELDASQAEQMRRIQLRRAEQVAAASRTANGDSVARDGKSGGEGAVGDGSGSTALDVPRVDGAAKVAGVQFTPDEVANLYHCGCALELLPLLAKTTLINHIICDPPYGINMEFMNGDGIARIAETHDVEENLKLIPAFLKVAYEVIAEDGFLAMWYDLDHHEKIARWAEEIGWRAQRWPFHWAKTTPCSNTQAQYNMTKTVETCYIFRRSEKSVLKQKRSNNWYAGPNPRNSTHPFTKPDDVWGILIDSLTSENQVVVDPFAGEGSCLAALFKRNRIPVGIEIDPKHIASGVNYILDELKKKDILEDFISPPI